MIQKQSMPFSSAMELEEVSTFIKYAEQFCILIETNNTINKNDFLSEIKAVLVELQFRASVLPHIELLRDNDIDEIEINIDENEILKIISQKVPFSYYWIAMNPLETNVDPEIGTGDLIDDLGDIYNDLKRALGFFAHGNLSYKEHALWKFKFDYEFHWHQHSVNALYAVMNYFLNND